MSNLAMNDIGEQFRLQDGLRDVPPCESNNESK